MKISEFCNSYFNGIEEVKHYKTNSKRINTLALLKILSYFTVIIPAGFALTNKLASLCGRAKRQDKLTPQDSKVNQQAQSKVIKQDAAPSSNAQSEGAPPSDTQGVAASIEPAAGNKSIKESQAEIISDEWGKIVIKVNGVEQTFKDAIILPSDGQQIAKEWNWKWDKNSTPGETGMSHSPGIRLKDIQQFILSKPIQPDVIILSLGRGHGGQRDNSGPGVLKISPLLQSFFKPNGIGSFKFGQNGKTYELYTLKTAAAIAKYNEIRDQGNKRVAALIHTTC